MSFDFLPDTDTMPQAISVSQYGFYSALIVAIITTIMATIALMAKKDIGGVDPWAYVDAILFGLIAWRIKRHSRVFAVIGLSLFVIEKVVQYSTGLALTSGMFMTAFILLGFVNGVRGTFAIHRIALEEAAPLSQ